VRVAPSREADRPGSRALAEWHRDGTCLAIPDLPEEAIMGNVRSVLVVWGLSLAGAGCDTSRARSVPGQEIPPSVCGDGLIEGTETCDDGNIAAGDGCSARCAAEPGAPCTVTFEAACSGACGVALAGGRGCDSVIDDACLGSGDRAFVVDGATTPAALTFDRDVTALRLSFVAGGDQVVGVLTFLHADGAEVDTLRTNGDCTGAPAAVQTVALPRGARSAVLDVTGGPVYLDDLTLDPR
jgi:cysteine-rich repeat protein